MNAAEALSEAMAYCLPVLIEDANNPMVDLSASRWQVSIIERLSSQGWFLIHSSDAGQQLREAREQFRQQVQRFDQDMAAFRARPTRECDFVCSLPAHHQGAHLMEVNP